MPPAPRPSPPAPVRAAGLVLTLVATAAGAAGAATLAPEDATAPDAARRFAPVASATNDLHFDERDARALATRRRDALDRTAAVNKALAAEAAREAAEYAQRVAMWDELAECETGGNWYDGGEFGGGLGIYVGTWVAYGGHDFAARPQWASKAEQIEVAERIADDGYGGWGCAHQLGWVD